MGQNNRAKKRRREEKAKVKFKVGKTLPKGQNVTDLKFRTRRIVVPEQLKQNETGAVVSTRKRKTLKELLALLTHFNSKARLEALEGLSEITRANFDEISSNSVAVVNKIAPVCSDKEDKVRRIAVKTLRDVLSRSSLVELRPSTHSLTANLSSCMTHVVPEIRGDSLAFLDAVLETHPSLLLAAASTDQKRRIFNDFLAQIAAPLKGEAAGARTAGVDWFVRVLSRLKLFCSRFSAAEGEVEAAKMLVFDRNRPIFACLDAPWASHSLLSPRADDGPPPGFFSSLSPLLLSVAAEVAGPDQTLSFEKAEAACCVAELFALLVTGDRAANRELAAKVSQAFRGFPYEVNAPVDALAAKKKRQRKKSDQAKKDVGGEDDDDDGSNLKAASVGVTLNLNLVHVFARCGVAGKLTKKIVDYVVELLEDKSWIGLCSSGEIRDAVTSLCSWSDEVKSRVLRAASVATCDLHPLKRERMELSRILADFFEDAYRKGSTDEQLRRWAVGTVELLEKDTVRPELFPLLVSLCKLGDSEIKAHLTNSLRVFIRGISDKTLHRSTWPTVSSDVFHLFSWIRLELSSGDRDALAASGCLTAAQLDCL